MLDRMKRDPALVPPSHDHHHDASVTVPHFREEEEQLFPLVADSDEAAPVIVQALLDHRRLHALAAQPDGLAEPRTTMVELADLLEAHVRREARELFPLIERLARERLDERQDASHNSPVLGVASDDLNATLLACQGRGARSALSVRASPPATCADSTGGHADVTLVREQVGITAPLQHGAVSGTCGCLRRPPWTARAACRGGRGTAGRAPSRRPA
jgi:hypothetical protein